MISSPKVFPRFAIAFSIGGMKIWAPSMMTALMFWQPSSTAFFTAPTAYIGWLPMLNEWGSVSSDGVIGQQAPNHVMSESAITGTIDSAKNVNEPTIDTMSSSTACRAHVAATAGSNCSSQTVTSSGWPAMPPRALMYCAYALAVLEMFAYVGPAALSVVTVMTLIGSPVGASAVPLAVAGSARFGGRRSSRLARGGRRLRRRLSGRGGGRLGCRFGSCRRGRRSAALSSSSPHAAATRPTAANTANPPRHERRARVDAGDPKWTSSSPSCSVSGRTMRADKRDNTAHTSDVRHLSGEPSWRPPTGSERWRDWLIGCNDVELRVRDPTLYSPERADPSDVWLRRWGLVHRAGEPGMTPGDDEGNDDRGDERDDERGHQIRVAGLGRRRVSTPSHRRV